MKNTFGQQVTVTLFGESHQEEIGVVIDGLTPGMRINEEFIKEQLDRRRPSGKISTARREQDRFRIVSGVFKGRTTGTPLCILIPNQNVSEKDYEKMKNLLRPSHADYAAFCKYHGFQDYRGGGHFSGRLTAPLVAAGAIAMDALSKKGILIGTHIKQCAGVFDREFQDFKEDIQSLKTQSFAVLDEKQGMQMKKEIEKAGAQGDSVGGVLQTAILNVPRGVGEPWFDSFESILAHGLFSIPAVKGVEFGLGYGFAQKRGSEVNDSFAMENDQVVTLSNNNGGINGGITNGMPVTFTCVIKPTPSIYKEQKTVDLEKKENTVISIEGRHDPAIIHRAGVVVESMTAIVVMDLLCGRFGTDYFAED